MRVCLTGATGFVGSYVLRELVRQDYAVRCLVRDPGVPLAADGPSVERVRADVTDRSSVVGTMDGCDAVIHLVGIIDEQPWRGITFERIHHQGTRHVIQAARAAGIDRFVHMSANGARQNARSTYQTTKWKAEQRVREAGFTRWTIFRPSIVFGDPGPNNISFEVRLARTLVRPFPVLPVFGDGTYQIQPVAVEDVAAGFVQALTKEVAVGKAYCPAGREGYTYNVVLDIIARAMNRRPKPKVHVPISIARPIVHVAGRLGLLPISPDQFEMLLEGNTCDAASFYADFDVEGKPFLPEHLVHIRERA